MTAKKAGTDYGAAIDQLAALKARFVTPFEALDEILTAAHEAQASAGSLRAEVTRLRGEVQTLQSERDVLVREGRDARYEAEQARQALATQRSQIAADKDAAEQAHAARLNAMASDFAVKLASAAADHNEQVEAMAQTRKGLERQAAERSAALDADLTAKTKRKADLEREIAALLKRLGA